MRAASGRSWLWAAAVLAAGCGGTTEPAQSPVQLDAAFDGGSLGSWTVNASNVVTFTLRQDTNSPTRYFFYFRVTGASGLDVTFNLSDALNVASAASWDYTEPVYSEDGGDTWSRITAAGMIASNYTFSLSVPADTVWIALKIPYAVSRWLDYASEIASDPLVQSIEDIGTSLLGNAIQLVTITDSTVPRSQKNGIWVVARQHPGEPGSSYMVEGFMDWLLGGSAQANELLRQAEVFLVPLMNPDGVLVGNQRVNTAGLDLNRQWMNPDPLTAPTVAATLDRIIAYRDSGFATRILIDFHSAPTARRNFFFYNEPGSSSQALHDEIVDVMTLAHQINPDFIELAGSTARPVDMGQRGRSWGYYALQTHGLTVESSGNDVTYGPNAGMQQTVDRLLQLGATVGMAVAETLYGIPQ